MRKYPERPIVGVGAVVFDGDRVLLVRRANEPLKGEWSLPGGALELGETLEDAVVREILEETGLHVEVGSVVEVLDRVRRDADGRVEYHYVIIDYACTARSGELAAGTDAADVQWIDVADLERLGVRANAIAVIKKAVAAASASRRSTPARPTAQ